MFQISIIGVITIILIELVYRYSVIDFYKSELQALNPDFKSNPVDYLVFGDSFSASAKNYVDLLRVSSNKTFVNTSVPGTGIKQVNTFASRRLKKFKPKNIIYQVYVGNDLIDVDHITNYKKISFVRNLYWNVSDVILSGAYINYKLSHLKSTKIKGDTTNFHKTFDVKNYTLRSKIYLRADNEYLYKTATVFGDFEKKYRIWQEELKKFLSDIEEGINVYIVFIPHCSQVNTFYRKNISELGAVFIQEDRFSNINYPFFEKASLDFKDYKNIILLNPLQSLRAADTSNNRLYYLNDPHLNKKGQKVLTKFLKKHLQLDK